MSLDRNLSEVFTALEITDRKRKALAPNTRKLICQPTFLKDGTNRL